jgi:hypothetical protein
MDVQVMNELHVKSNKNSINFENANYYFIKAAIKHAMQKDITMKNFKSLS